MVAHAGFREQDVADEQISPVDGPTVFRKGRAVERETGTERRHQRLGDRPDIAGVGRIEGRAIFEQDLPGPRRLQPGERREALLDRLARRNRPALQRDHDRLGIGNRRARRRHINQLHRAHPAPHQRVAQIGGAGEIVGNGSQEHAHDALPRGPVLQ